MKKSSCNLFFACIVAFSILLLSLPGYADNNALQVKCVDPSGKPVSDVKVAAFSFNSNKATGRRSDSQGIAEFTKMDNGVYRVFGHKDGFAPAFFEYVGLKDNQQTVTLTFAPGDDRKLYFEDQVEAQRMKTLITQAVNALNGGKFGEAETFLKQALQINPYGPDVLYFYGSALLSQFKFDQGVELLKRAAELAGVLSGATPSGKADPSKKLIDSIQDKLKKDLPALRGESLLKQNKYDEALKNFAEAAQNDPSNPSNYAYMAMVNANSKKYEEALALVEKAIQLKPGDKTYMDLKASISDMKEKTKGNEAILKAETIRIKAETLQYEGDKLGQSEDYAGAIKKYEEAKELESPAKQSPLWVKIARANAKLNQPDTAIAAFKRAIELAPEKEAPTYRDVLTGYYLENKKYDEAIDVIAKTPHPSSKSTEQILSDMATAKKDKEMAYAEAIFEQVLKINPGNVDVYFELGQLYYMDGKSKDRRTKELLKKYLEIGKDTEKLQRAKDFLVVVNRRSK
jgi:tetratricopeptide (TPR) repeat protein